jgi:uncharacterized protein (TIGR03000 family)
MAALTTGGQAPGFGHNHHGWGGPYCGAYAGVSCGGGWGGYVAPGFYQGWGWGYDCYGCNGGYGCWGWHGYPGYGDFGYGGFAHGTYAPVVPFAGTASAASPVVNTAQATTPATERATLFINVPADARLTVDGAPTNQQSARRVFNSPPLQPGKDYYYELKAEVTRDGHAYAKTQRVTVRAGRELVVTLDVPTETVSAGR